MSHAHDGPPSEFLASCAGHLPAQGDALDLAAGRGRNARWLAARGLRVTAIDRDREGLEALAGDGITVVVADLEIPGATLPLAAFDVIVVCRYLWRPLFPAIRRALRAGGILVYETFTVDQLRFGRPTNPDHLLGPNELLHRFLDWRILRYVEAATREPERVHERRGQPSVFNEENARDQSAVAALAAQKPGQFPG